MWQGFDAECGAQNDSLVFSVANVCKLLLASNLAILDVIVVRLLELVGKPQYGPRNLQQVRPAINAAAGFLVALMCRRSMQSINRLPASMYGKAKYG